MPDVVENIIRDVGCTEVRQHRLEFALVPALSNTSSDIEVVARGGEEVLALTCSLRDEMLEIASVGSDGGSCSNGIVPNQWSSVVVSTSGVVVVENCILVS